jgi:arylsulfatase A-like enzyme
MIRTTEWKYIHRYPYGPHELYDLINDPDELRNVVEDSSHRDTIERMRLRLEEWFTRYVDPALDGVRQPVTGKGQLDLVGPDRPPVRSFDDDWHYLSEKEKPR